MSSRGGHHSLLRESGRDTGLGRDHRTRDQAWYAANDEGRGDPIDHAADRVHDDRALESIDSLRRRAEARGFGRVEVYRRVADRVRVGLRPPSRTPERSIGHEEGTAVRVALPDGRRGFGASSGGGSRSLDLALSAAVRNAVPVGARTAGWWSGEPGARSDPDGAMSLPGTDDLEAWLDRVLEQRRRASRTTAVVHAIQVEVAATVETLSGYGNWVALRGRRRAWVLGLERRGSAGDAPEATWSLAGRSLDEVEAACRTLPRLASGPSDRPTRDRAGVVVTADAACILVAALARTVHAESAAIGLGVGPGWTLIDDPLDGASLFHGTFDDAGFPTERRRLADGRTVVASIGAAGNFRRGSYREPPVPMATNLSLEPPEAGSPPRAIWVDDVRIHPLSQRDWILELHPSDRDRAWVDPLIVRSSPETLVSRCVGGMGGARRSPRGVTSPSLVFEDLPIRS